MLSSKPSPRRGVRLSICLICMALLTAACGKSGSKSSSQVGVKVNGEEVSVHQLELAVQRQTVGLATVQADVAAQRVLQGVIDQELAAQAARKQGLERDPRVVQMMEAAKRDVLARAYIEHLSDTATEPSTSEVDRYYETHPALFSQRKLYVLRETLVAVPATRRDAFAEQVRVTDTLPQLNELLSAQGLSYTMRNISLPAEEVALDTLDRLAAAQDGQSVVLPHEQGVRVLTVISTQSAPIDRTVGRRLITLYMANERKLRLAQQGIKAIRDTAKIEYQGRYAQLQAAATGSAPAASPAP
jgi:EpsD family peptidyl-prolyl cis-trans isomerase